MVIHADFETRGSVDLADVGVDVYTRHKDTDIWCLGWAIDDDEPEIWIPGELIPFDLQEAMYTEHAAFSAHNCGFELAVWNNIMVERYHWPRLDPARCRCTMAMGYAMGLPGKLEKMAAAVGIPQQKDMVGHRLMMQMSRPRLVKSTGEVVWWDSSQNEANLQAYCQQDVRVEQELYRRLLKLSAEEQALWNLDYRINQRGVFIDAAAVQKAVEVVRIEGQRLNQEIQAVTSNMVSSTTEVARLTKWLREQGIEIDALAKADVIDALNQDYVPDHVRRALLLRQEGGKTSTAKLNTILNIRSPQDGRVRDILQFHAAATGRWGGRRLQPQNMPRPAIKHAVIEMLLDQFPSRSAEELIAIMRPLGSPVSLVSDCLRGMICAAPGNELMAGDYANIEGRVLAWLAGEQWKLDAFSAYDFGTGPDIYELGYSKSFHVPVESVTKDQRQIGKVQELALGYQGGVGAFQKMARNYNVVVSDERAEEIKLSWRAAHPYIESYWRLLEGVATMAVAHPGIKHSTGPVGGRTISYVVKGSFLFCRLPSGRVLTYPYPKLKAIKTPWGEMKEQVHYMKVDALTKKWQETHTYGGSLTENVVQAVSRDLLAAALVRVEAAGFPVVLHVHDEVVSELPIGKKSLHEFTSLIAELPQWATGLPVTVEGWVGQRYRKG